MENYLPLPKDIIDYIIMPFIESKQSKQYDWVIHELNIKCYEQTIAQTEAAENYGDSPKYEYWKLAMLEKFYWHDDHYWQWVSGRRFLLLEDIRSFRKKTLKKNQKN